MIVLWVAKNHFTTAVIVSEFLELAQRAQAKGEKNINKKATDLLLEMSSSFSVRKDGVKIFRPQLLKKVENFVNQGQNLYMLAPEGLALATRLFPFDYQYNFLPSSIDHYRILHSIGVQYVSAVLLRREKEKDNPEFSILDFYPERVFNFPEKSKKADVVLRSGEKIIGIEFERSEKSGERLDRFFQEIENSIFNGFYDSFMIYSENSGTIQRYKKHISKDFSRWKMQGKRWVKSSTKPLHESIKNRIRLFELKSVGRAIRPITYGNEVKRKKLENKG